MTVPFTSPMGLFINNSWVEPASKDKEAVLNPATEEVLGYAPVGGRGEVNAAIAAAREAFQDGPWPSMSHSERAAIVQKLHDYLSAHGEEIKQLVIAEAGAIRMLADTIQVVTALEDMQYAIDLARKKDFRTPLPLEIATNPVSGARMVGGAVVHREPVGVVAGITPYNFPLFMNLSKVAPALLMGNTVVLKPSPFTPFEALLLGHAALEVGLPKGVLNIVTGGTDVGEILTTDPRVDMVTFTGSDTVGAAIMAQGANTLKRVLLELGGKSALIVRADADLNAAVMAGISGFTIHSGQACAATTRQLVHNSVRKQYVEMIAAMLPHLKIGNPSASDTRMGPLIRETQRQRCEMFVEKGLDSGATLVYGGKKPPGIDKGFFFEPTLFDNVDNKSEIAQKEIFGPIGVVIGFDTDEEAIALANDSDFGLSGHVFSKDTATAYEMAMKLRTGGVSINGGPGKKLSTAPFGGFKRSGLGREYGEGWLDEYSEAKSIQYHMA